MNSFDPALDLERHVQLRVRPEFISITFDNFVEFGRHVAGANIVNGMPWSFVYRGLAVTHENDQRYIVAGKYDFLKGDVLLIDQVGGVTIVSQLTFDTFYEEKK